MFSIKWEFTFLILKLCMETTLENFARKTCYDYFCTYDVTLICSLLVRILYSSYMLYRIKKRTGNIVKNCTKTITCDKCIIKLCQNMLFKNITLDIKIKIIFYFKDTTHLLLLSTTSWCAFYLYIMMSIPSNQDQTQDFLLNLTSWTL
jgi:hypothetical protein